MKTLAQANPNRSIGVSHKKKIIACLALSALAGIASAQTYVTNTVPGGTFDPGFDSSYWTNNSGGGTFVFSYPTTGGNPDGYALMDATAGGSGWGVFVGAVYNGSNNGDPIPLSSLGLAANVPCTVLMDMKIEAGTSIGGLKLESYDSGNLLIAGSDTSQYPSSGTADWATYSFAYTPAPGATGIKFVPLWGPNSSIGYDNVRVIVPTSLPLTATITFPADSATVSTNFTMNAAASVFPASVTNVNFYAGDTLLGNDETAPFSLNVVGAPEGAAALTVVAQDDNGDSVTSAVVNVTITASVVETIVKVDPSQNWLGYMNWYETPQNYGAYASGSAWGVDALTARFSGAGPASVLTLLPAPINDTNSYWYDYTDASYPVGTNGAVGFKSMEANMYVEMPGVNGNLITFTGTVNTNTLVSPSSTNLIGNGWTCVAFIKDLAPDYSSFTVTNIDITNGMTFSISLLTQADSARHVQYGFQTVGPDVWPSDVTNYGKVEIQSLDASPTNIYVNSSAPWVGYMNVANTPQDGGAYQFGSGWGTADLKAVFDGFGLTLSPNNIGDPDPYWYIGGGAPGAVGNKIMDASMYVEIGSLPGRNLVFSGTVLSNTLVSASNTNAAGNGWTSVAFVKDFAPDYSSVNSATVPLTPGAFSVSLNTVNDPARHVQYGFETVGPDVWVTDSAAFGNVVIENVAVLAPVITPSLDGGLLNLSFPTQTGHAYTVQYKTNLTDAVWSTLTITNGTGLNSVITDEAGDAQRFYKLSVQ